MKHSVHGTRNRHAIHARKKNKPGLINRNRNSDFMHDRHQDWAVIVCLVGGGQEINTERRVSLNGLNLLNHSFPQWHIYISPRLSDSEYGAETL